MADDVRTHEPGPTPDADRTDSNAEHPTGVRMVLEAILAGIFTIATLAVLAAITANPRADA